MLSMREVCRKLVRRFTSCGVVLSKRAKSAGRTFLLTISLSINTLTDKLADKVTQCCPRLGLDGAGTVRLSSK